VAKIRRRPLSILLGGQADGDEAVQAGDLEPVGHGRCQRGDAEAEAVPNAMLVGSDDGRQAAGIDEAHAGQVQDHRGRLLMKGCEQRLAQGRRGGDVQVADRTDNQHARGIIGTDVQVHVVLHCRAALLKGLMVPYPSLREVPLAADRRGPQRTMPRLESGAPVTGYVGVGRAAAIPPRPGVRHARLKAVELYIAEQQQEDNFAAKAQAIVEEIGREAEARRNAIQGLFGRKLKQPVRRSRSDEAVGASKRP
jgi:hypothetical protein